jgi:hypothetical protein
MTGCLLAAILVSPSLLAQLTISAVGDTRITPRLLEHLPQIRLQGDLVFANFEGVLAEPADKDSWKFCMPLSALDTLAGMGINAVNLANNHSLDMGTEARQHTMEALTQRFAVAGPSGEQALLTIRGLRVRVLGFSFDGANDVNDLATIPTLIHRGHGEIVIVSAHMGGENRFSQRIPFTTETFGKEQRGDVVAFSHRAIDAGADLVLGHGPHVPRGIELYKNKLIVYSLGNFLFDYPGATLNPHAPGYAITVKLDGNGDFLSAHISSYDLQYGIPKPDPGEQAYKLIRQLTLDNLRHKKFAFLEGGTVERCKKQESCWQ